MTSNTTKPFSVRLSETLGSLIQKISAQDQKTPSDIIREAVEAYSKNSYRNQFVPLLDAAKETVSQIRDRLEQLVKGEPTDPLTRPELSALMYFWHNAYLSASGFANPSYVRTILDITQELLEEAQRHKLDVQLRYIHSKLDLETAWEAGLTGYASGFEDLKKRYAENCTASWAETLARPIATLADYLDQFSDEALSRILTVSRLYELLPVAVKFVGSEMSDHTISRDMHKVLPDPKKFQIEGVKFSVTAEPFCIVANGEHHCYVFRTESLMSLALFSETDISFIKNRLGAGLTRPTLEVQISQGGAIIHEHSGYRLCFTEPGFMALREQINAIFSDSKWKWLLQRFRNLKGDF
jgi:hypothetical protein